MPNSRNTTWIVGCVLWRPVRRGVPDITHCDGRSYRSENNARERYDALVDSFKERGYSIEPIKSPKGSDYFGVQIHSETGHCGVVYVDRNPVYTPY